MAIYTVHAPEEGDVLNRADRTKLVRDGFSGWAFVFGPLFLLRHRAWIAAAAWIIVVIGGAFACGWLHLPWTARLALLLLVALFTGLEGNGLRRHALDRRGFGLVDVVDGRNKRDGEERFFHRIAAGGSFPTPVARRPLASTGPVIGFDFGPQR